MESLKFVDAFGRKCPGLNTSFYTFRGSFFQILHFYLFVLLWNIFSFRINASLWPPEYTENIK